MRLVFHAGKENRDDAIQILKDQFRYDLKDILDDADELVGVEFGDTVDIGAFSHQKTDHGNIENGTKFHKCILEE